ncbi:hypothetical protein ACL02R_29870 [Streptomyces sp. MS19]|uniref:hypothetical protein n=1 Tax=Streptomyces sp. MS19 TaxID=3385972 RepID=UPI0039A10151
MSDTSDISAPPPGEAAEVRAGVAEACADLAGIRDVLAGTPDESALDALLAAVRDGTHDDRAAALDALDEALQRAGDAAGLYEDTAARHWGVDRAPDQSGTDPGYGALPVTPRPAAAVFLCPTGSCSRRWLPTAAQAAPPSCALLGEPLRWERL